MSEGVAKTGALYLVHIFRHEGRNVHLTEKRISQNIGTSRTWCETVLSPTSSVFHSFPHKHRCNTRAWKMKHERKTAYSMSEQTKWVMMEEKTAYRSCCPCSCVPWRQINSVRKMNHKPVRAFPLFHLSFFLSFTPFVPFLPIHHIHIHSYALPQTIV